MLYDVTIKILKKKKRFHVLIKLVYFKKEKEIQVDY